VDAVAASRGHEAQPRGADGGGSAGGGDGGAPAEGRLREIFRFAARDVAPRDEALLRAQGLAEPGRAAPRVRLATERALERFVRLAEPCAIVEAVSRATFAEVYAAADEPTGRSVVGRIAPRGEALALYAATVGEPVCAEIRGMFAAGDPAVGYLLDAAASAAADRLSELCAARWRERLAASVSPAARVLPYSPGYCGWPTRGQRGLFAVLRPEEIGIALSESCLMAPLKSVSGLLVAAPFESHVFATDFEFCEACATHACRTRLQALARS
jgi:hypothetical protein